jgi:hypothetical protein
MNHLIKASKVKPRFDGGDPRAFGLYPAKKKGVHHYYLQSDIDRYFAAMEHRPEPFVNWDQWERQEKEKIRRQK